MLVREVGVAFVAGLGAGIVTGLASRVAMKISALMAGFQLLAITENGNLVGDFTLEGTLGLVVFAGIGPGILAGALFVAARPWLRRFGRWDGLAFGAALLLMSGSAVIEPGNGDFRRFGPPALNVALFAALFLVLGLGLGVLARAARRAPPRVLTLAGVVGIVPVVGSLLMVGIAAALTYADPTEPRLGESALGLGLIAASIVLALALRRLGGVSRASWAALAIPVMIGGVATVSAVRHLVS